VAVSPGTDDEQFSSPTEVRVDGRVGIERVFGVGA
jgi:hypothetical protein